MHAVTGLERSLNWNVLAPRARHKPRVPDGVRIYAVGDIHGRADLLDALLVRIDKSLEISPIGQPLEVYLGDYIDRGPDSRDVIDRLLARQKQRRLVLLKGNHEDYAIRFLNDPSLLSEWSLVGGIQTLLSYGVTPSTRTEPKEDREIAAAFDRALPVEHRMLLENLAPSHTCGDYFFAHAGVRPRIPLEQQAEQDLIWIREDFLLYEEDFAKMVVHGHTPVKEPDFHSNRINIDTGAYATGRLTCLVLQGTEMIVI